MTLLAFVYLYGVPHYLFFFFYFDSYSGHARVQAVAAMSCCAFSTVVVHSLFACFGR